MGKGKCILQRNAVTRLTWKRPPSAVQKWSWIQVGDLRQGVEIKDCEAVLGWNRKGHAAIKNQGDAQKIHFQV